MLSRDALLACIDVLRNSADVADSALVVVRQCRHHDLRTEYGYAASDAIDAEAERLITGMLRTNDRAGRVAEGVYALMLVGLRHGNHALLAVNRLQRAFHSELSLHGNPLHCPIVVGLLLLDQHAGPAEFMLRDADLAASAAERDGVPLLRCAPGESPDALPTQALRDALASNELEVWMQPQWTLPDRRLVGAESLARWNSPTLGWVSAGRFIALAERSSLISDLTRWSLNASLLVCRQACLLDPAMQVAVNLSPSALLEEDLVEQVLSALRLWDVPAASIVLEITEGAIMRNPGNSGLMIQQLFDAGIGIALDDFGSGYSSFGYLRDFPASELKIDRSFVTGLATDSRSRQLVRSMIELAHNLDMVVVAEGVEDAATLELLCALNCDRAQGNYLSPPLPAEQYLALLAAHAAARNTPPGNTGDV